MNLKELERLQAEERKAIANLKEAEAAHAATSAALSKAQAAVSLARQAVASAVGELVDPPKAKPKCDPLEQLSRYERARKKRWSYGID